MSRLTPLERLMLPLIAIFSALAGVANYRQWPPVERFALATLALAGLAWLVSFATEQLGERLGPGVTGMLQATLGNLPELFVVIFALQKGELIVAQTAIVGSVLANALLVLGLVIVVGARRAPDGVMRFSKRLPQDTATLLLVTVFIIVLLALSLGSHDPASHHVQAISVVGAICLLVVYLTWVGPYLRSDSARHARQAGRRQIRGEQKALPDAALSERASSRDPLPSGSALSGRASSRDPLPAASALSGPASSGELSPVGAGPDHPSLGAGPAGPPHRGASWNETPQRGGGESPQLRAGGNEPPQLGADEPPYGSAGRGEPRLGLELTLALLLVAGGVSAFVSDWFVNALSPAIAELNISQAFAGLVIVAIAGNAVEHVSGLVLAWKGRSDLAISVVKNSVAQIAAFLFPLLVLVSLLLATSLTFALAPVYTGALALTALLVWQVTGDGEAVAFEGWALVALYVILATLTLYE